MHSWRILLLPYLERNDLYKRYRFDEPWNGLENSKLAAEMPSQFAFAGTHLPGQTTSINFVAVTGPGTAWPGTTSLQMTDITDGTSNTIFFAEYNGPAIHWMEPRDLSFQDMSFVVDDPQGISSQYLAPAVALGDGSVQRLDLGLSPNELRAMCTAAGNDVPSTPSAATQVMEDARQRPLKP